MKTIGIIFATVFCLFLVSPALADDVPSFDLVFTDMTETTNGSVVIPWRADIDVLGVDIDISDGHWIFTYDNGSIAPYYVYTDPRLTNTPFQYYVFFYVGNVSAGQRMVIHANYTATLNNVKNASAVLYAQQNFTQSSTSSQILYNGNFTNLAMNNIFWDGNGTGTSRKYSVFTHNVSTTGWSGKTGFWKESGFIYALNSSWSKTNLTGSNFSYFVDKTNNGYYHFINNESVNISFNSSLPPNGVLVGGKNESASNITVSEIVVYNKTSCAHGLEYQEPPSPYRPTQIIIDAPSSNMYVFETRQLSATVFPVTADQRVTWSVNNTTHAHVNALGSLYARVGDVFVEVTATSMYDPSVSGSRTFYIASKPPESIAISGPSSLYVSDTDTYTATVLPSSANQSVIWGVNNTSRATISSTGVLTALSEGDVVITARSAVDSSVSVAKIVQIKTRPSVSISGPSSLYVSERATYTATVLPSSANQSVIWSVNNTSRATISSTGVLTALSEGDVVITAQSKAEPSAIKSLSLTIIKPSVDVLLIDVAQNGSSTEMYYIDQYDGPDKQIGYFGSYVVFNDFRGDNRSASWSYSNNNAILTPSPDLKFATLVPTAPGSGKVTLTIMNNGIVIASKSIDVVIKDAYVETHSYLLYAPGSITLSYTAQPENMRLIYTVSANPDMDFEVISTGQTTSGSIEVYIPYEGDYYWNLKYPNGTTTPTRHFVVHEPVSSGTMVFNVINESNLTQKIENATITVINDTFYNSFKYNGTNLTFDGTGNYIVHVSAPEFTTRQFYVRPPGEYNFYLSPLSADLVSMRFSLVDNTGDFPATTSILTIDKQTEAGTINVFSSHFEAGGTISTLLEANCRYILKVSNSGTERIVGFIVPTYSDSIQIVVGELVSTTISYPNGNFSYSLKKDSQTGTIVFTWNRDKSDKSTIDFFVQAQNNSDEHFDIHTKTSFGSATYAVLDLNETYIITIKKGDFFEKLIWTPGKWLSFPDISPTTRNLIGIGVLVIIALLFSPINSQIGAFVVAGLATIMWVLGILYLPFMVIAWVLFFGIMILLGNKHLKG